MLRFRQNHTKCDFAGTLPCRYRQSARNRHFVVISGTTFWPKIDFLCDFRIQKEVKKVTCHFFDLFLHPKIAKEVDFFGQKWAKIWLRFWPNSNLAKFEFDQNLESDFGHFWPKSACGAQFGQIIWSNLIKKCHFLIKSEHFLAKLPLTWVILTKSGEIATFLVKITQVSSNLAKKCATFWPLFRAFGAKKWPPRRQRRHGIYRSPPERRRPQPPKERRKRRKEGGGRKKRRREEGEGGEEGRGGGSQPRQGPTASNFSLKLAKKLRLNFNVRAKTDRRNQIALFDQKNASKSAYATIMQLFTTFSKKKCNFALF
mgnify:CR=1 FL=1